MFLRAQTVCAVLGGGTAGVCEALRAADLDQVCAKLKLGRRTVARYPVVQPFCVARFVSYQSSYSSLSYPAFATIQDESDSNSNDHSCGVFAPAEDYDISGTTARSTGFHARWSLS